MLWLGHPHCHEVAQVGGKAANLSRLATRFQVPPGFCLPTTAYADWSAAACFDTLQMLPLLSNRIAAAYAELARSCGVPEPSVAVRSSAVDEDGSLASFAGLYETSLNVVGLSAVAEAVVRCWASGESERARAYRRRHGRALDGFRMAVLVQQFIPSEIAAVVFSANPVTGHRDEVMINVSWGLGESIVGGRVSPDTYVVRFAFRVINYYGFGSLQPHAPLAISYTL